MKQIKRPIGYSQGRPGQRGFSLIELMIALTIGMLLLLALGTLFVNTGRNRAELDKAGRQIENGRYAMQVLSTDVQHAGFYGQLVSLSAPGSMPTDCSSSNPGVSAMQAGITLPVSGFSQPATAPGCVSATSLAAGNDILVIRRASTDIGSGVLSLQATPERCVFSGPGATASTSSLPCEIVTAVPVLGFNKVGGTPADVRQYMVHVYFIDNVSGIPTLKRMVYGLDGTSKYTAESLVDGIERMVIDYGLDTNNDGTPDSYSRDPSTPAAWSDVVSVRISLLARNTEETRGYTDTKTYELGGLGSVGPFDDSFKRHVYTQVVRVTNVSIRREKGD